MSRLVFLWTDILICLLVGLTLLFVRHARVRAQIRDAWRRGAQSRTALSAAVILGVYVCIGLVDSIHFNPRLQSAVNGNTTYSPEVLSLLDLLASEWRERSERTYSAPLATHAFVKETIELPDGSKVRDYPRLRYGGAHLGDPKTEWLGDVLRIGLKGSLVGTLIWFALISLIAHLKPRGAEGTFSERLRRLLRGGTELPRHAALWTLLAVFVLSGVVLALSAHYHVLGTDKVGQNVLYQAV